MRNNPLKTKITKEGKGGGAPAAKTGGRAYGGAGISLQSVEDVEACGSCGPQGTHSGGVREGLQPVERTPP